MLTICKLASQPKYNILKNILNFWIFEFKLFWMLYYKIRRIFMLAYSTSCNQRPAISRVLIGWYLIFLQTHMTNVLQFASKMYVSLIKDEVKSWVSNSHIGNLLVPDI